MQKLINIQKELKAPKGNYNSFGKYKYRSCEDILEAAKPLLAKEGCTLTISDDIVHIGERYYIKATACISDGTESKTVTALARESFDKKGMDDAQITGTASSYARKYALNGLFLIDDTKDADTDEFNRQIEKEEPIKVELATAEQKQMLKLLCGEQGIDLNDLAKQVGVKPGYKMTAEQYGKALRILNGEQ